MENLDLDINNYNLDDILRLFKIDKNFDTNDVKKCYKMVLKLHPDKSGLDKEYFLFYTKALKILKNVFEYKNKRNTHLDEYKSKIEYLDIDEQDPGKKLLVDNLHKKKGEDFNKWFNDMFEKVKIHDDEIDTGYGNWFKSAEDIETEKIHNKRDMAGFFEKKKQQAKALVVHKDFVDQNNDDGYNLSREKINNYDSSLFSKLNYQDLKQAHTVTVVPVTQKDYENKKGFIDDIYSELWIYQFL